MDSNDDELAAHREMVADEILGAHEEKIDLTRAIELLDEGVAVLRSGDAPRSLDILRRVSAEIARRLDTRDPNDEHSLAGRRLGGSTPIRIDDDEVWQALAATRAKLENNVLEADPGDDTEPLTMDEEQTSHRTLGPQGMSLTVPEGDIRTDGAWEALMWLGDAIGNLDRLITDEEERRIIDPDDLIDDADETDR